VSTIEALQHGGLHARLRDLSTSRSSSSMALVRWARRL